MVSCKLYHLPSIYHNSQKWNGTFTEAGSWFQLIWFSTQPRQYDDPNYSIIVDTWYYSDGSSTNCLRETPSSAPSSATGRRPWGRIPSPDASLDLQLKRMHQTDEIRGSGCELAMASQWTIHQLPLGPLQHGESDFSKRDSIRTAPWNLWRTWPPTKTWGFWLVWIVHWGFPGVNWVGHDADLMDFCGFLLASPHLHREKLWKIGVSPDRNDVHWFHLMNSL